MMKKLLLLVFVNVGSVFGAVDADGLQESFFTAVRNGDFEQVQQLVQQGASIFSKDKSESTALMWAACGLEGAVNKEPSLNRDYLSIVKFLVKNGVNIQERNNNGYSALSYAVVLAQLPVLKYLILQGADMSGLGNKDGFTALHYAAVAKKDYDIVPVIKELIKSGACLDARDSVGKTPLCLALECWCEDRVEAFIKGGADVDAIAFEGATVSTLIYAFCICDLSMVKKMVEAGANVKWRDTIEQPLPLLEAILVKKPEIVEYLISVGVPVNASSHGLTPLITAAYEGDLRSLKALLDAGAKRDAQTKIHNSALFFLTRLASVEDALAGIKLLLDAPGNRTLLIQKSKMTQGTAHLKNIFNTTSYLINMKNQSGLTALMSAVDVAKPALVKALLEYPVLDKEVRNDIGRTALDIARIARDDDVDLMDQGGVIDPLELANKLEIVALLEKPRHVRNI